MKPQEAESHVEIGKEMKTFSASRYVWRKLLAAKSTVGNFAVAFVKVLRGDFLCGTWRRPPLKGWEPLSIRQSTGDFNKSLGPSALEFQQGAASELSQGEEKKIHAG